MTIYRQIICIRANPRTFIVAGGWGALKNKGDDPLTMISRVILFYETRSYKEIRDILTSQGLYRDCRY